MLFQVTVVKEQLVFYISKNKMLKKQKVKIFLEQIKENNLNDNYQVFSNYRILKIENSIDDKTKSRNIQTEILLNYAINYQRNQYIPYPEIITNKQGKPEFSNLAIKFNISHSKKYLAIATSNKDVGIDIESIDIKHLKVASKLFSNQDFLKYQNNIDEIIKQWTIKEAYIKLYGLTMLIDLKKLIVKNNKVISKYGKAYYYTYKFDNHYLTIVSKKASKIKIISENILNI